MKVQYSDELRFESPTGGEVTVTLSTGHTDQDVGDYIKRLTDGGYEFISRTPIVPEKEPFFSYRFRWMVVGILLANLMNVFLDWIWPHG